MRQVIGESGDRVIGDTINPLPRVKNYRDLLVWQQAIELVERIYILTAKFPKEEMYGLTSQVRRAAASIASNIAEGHTRDSLKEYLQFLSIASASLAEAQTQLYISKRLKLALTNDVEPIEDLADKTLKMLRNLQRALREKL